MNGQNETFTQESDKHDFTLIPEQPTIRVVSPIPSEASKTDYLTEMADAKGKLNAFISFGEYTSAIDIALKLHRAHPNDDALRFQYAQVLALYGDDTDEVSRQVIALQKANYPEYKIFDLRGDLALKSNDPILAKEWWENAINAEPEAADIHIKLGNLLEHTFKGSKRAAANHYRMAAEISETDTVPYLAYANVMLEYLDKPKKAAKSYQKAATLNPLSSEAWYGLALSAHHSGDAKTASHAYQKAIALDTSLRSDILDKLFKAQETKIDAIQINDNQSLTVLITGASSGHWNGYCQNICCARAQSNHHRPTQRAFDRAERRDQIV